MSEAHEPDTVDEPEDDGLPDEIEQSTQRAREERWHSICPARFRHAHTDQLDGALATAVANWRANPARNLLVVGDVGVGKTHAVIAAARLANDAGWDVRIHDVTTLLQQMRPGQEGGDDLFARALACHALVLDDLGGEKTSDWTVERLYSLINQRWLDQLPVLATSNLDPGALSEALGQRTYDRLRDDAVTAAVTGDSRRGPA